jgi:UDP-N-acetylglucosamine 4-epimerase
MLLSRADIGRSRRLLGYQPTKGVMDGLESTMDWYIANLSPAQEPVKEVVNV